MKIKVFLITFILFFTTLLFALENPLTLGESLKIAKKASFSQLQQQFFIDFQKQNIKQYENIYLPNIYIDYKLGIRESFLLGEEDTFAFLTFKQKLLNNETDTNIKSEKLELEMAKQQLKQLFLERKLKVINAFFNVVLSDLEYSYSNEALAVVAVAQDKEKDRHSLGHTSDISLLKKQTIMQEYLQKRMVVEAKQRTSRAKLARILNDPKNLPDEVIKPILSYYWGKEIPEIKIWQEIILENNINLKILKIKLDKLSMQLNNEKNDFKFNIDSYLRLGEQSYNREKNGQWKAGVNMSFPIFDSNQQNNKIKKIMIKLKQQQLLIDDKKEELMEESLVLWLKLKTIKQKHTNLKQQLEYQDLYLERARSSYDLEIKSDLGDAMSNLTKIEWLIAKNEFDYVKTWNKINILTGGKLEKTN